jgi:hypothetical protein
LKTDIFHFAEQITLQMPDISKQWKYVFVIPSEVSPIFSFVYIHIHCKLCGENTKFSPHKQFFLHFYKTIIVFSLSFKRLNRKFVNLKELKKAVAQAV